MIDNEIGILVFARVNSNRLSQKVLQEINGVPCLEILLNHVINDKYPTIIVTPDDEENKPIFEIAARKGVEVFKSKLHNPLAEALACAENYGFEHIVRITADDILIDQTLMVMQIDFHVRGDRDYTWMKRCPEGVAGEVISVKALHEIYEELMPARCEFISYYLKQPKFNYIEYYPPKEYQHSFRLTIDYEEDLILLRGIFSLLKNPGTLDIINLLKQNKYLLRINHLPKVSILTSVFNTANFIQQTMESVFNQSFGDYEFIIIDDHSKDFSCDKILEYINVLSWDKQNKIRIMRNSENTGQAKCLNRGLEMARGKYIMCLDADDILYSDALQTLVNVIEQDQSEVVMAGYDRIDETDKIIETVETNEKHLGCSLISKWSINELKFREDIPFMVGTDYLNRLKKNCSISYIKDQLWGYRKREGQLTRDENHPENIEVK